MKRPALYIFFTLLASVGLHAQSPEASEGDVHRFAQADVVFVGEVLERETVLALGRSRHQFRVAVEELVHGSLNASPVVVEVFGDAVLQPGERVLLFLGSGGDGALLDLRGFETLGAAAAQQVVPGARMMCPAVASGAATDPGDDAVANALVSPSPDLVTTNFSSNGTDLTISARFEPSTFDASTSRAHFFLDIDEDVETGFKGVLGNDQDLLGVEFIIAFERDQVQVRQFDPTLPPGGSRFNVVANLSANILSDGFRAVVPLDLLAQDDVFKYKACTDVKLGATFTSETDYIPDVGLAPARTRPTGNEIAAPSNLQAIAVGANQINLNWKDNSNNEQQFEIERRAQGGAFQRVALVGQNVSFYQDEEVNAETTYIYRVRGVDDGCPSTYSGTAQATTPNAGELRPNGLTAEALSASEVELQWVDRAVTEGGYEVQARTEEGEFATVQTLPADSEGTVVDGLTESTSYTFRVRATGGVGDSSFSNQATATTFLGDPEPCVAGPNILCLQDGRFQVEVDWRDFDDVTGSASDAGLTSPDSGLLYFFRPANWEMLVKVIDGCGFNGHFWVFAAATTNVEYTLKVTDTVSGFVQTYHNDLGVSSDAITDTSAFATCAGSGLGTSPSGQTEIQELPTLTGIFSQTETTEKATGICEPSETALCLNGEQYLVEIEWADFDGNTGVGHVDALQSTDSGLFWFFNENNLEMLVKVLDGCGFNGRQWVFAAATTNVEYTLRVTEVSTGEVNEYFNPLGNAAAAVTDTAAFTNCP